MRFYSFFEEKIERGIESRPVLKRTTLNHIHVGMRRKGER